MQKKITLNAGIAKLTVFLYIAVLASCTSNEEKAIVIPKGKQTAEEFSKLPYFKTGTQTYQFSSTDPAEDQFNDFGHWLYDDKNGNSVLADITGPGCIYRIWATGNNGDEDKIKIYIDGQEKPIVDETFNQFCNFPPLRQNPQVGYGGDKYLAWWSYMPITFEKSCKIVREGYFRPFYSITYHTYTDKGNVISTTNNEDYTTIERIWSHPESDPKDATGNVRYEYPVSIPSGQEKVISQLDNAGYIASIKTTNIPDNKNVRIKIFWDGEQKPSVDAPLKWFFGSVDNGGDLKALGVGSIDKAGYCYFPMPFWKSAKIVIENRSDTIVDNMNIEIQYNPTVYEEEQCGYFHAFANENDTPDKKYTCLKTNGRGHVVGMAKRMPKGGHACEGDEVFFIDGRSYPDIYGTGEEDYNNNAWWNNSYNSYPTHGCIGNDCYYRIHYPDFIIYENSLDMEFETWQNFYIASVVWYYEKDEPSLVLSDSIDIGNIDSEEKHSYNIVNELWSGKKTGIYPGKHIYHNEVSDDGRSLNGYSLFNVNIDKNNKGIRLRIRTENKDIQVANVYVNGELVTERPWMICKNRSDALWIDADFEIPEKYTAGKKSIQIKIENSPESTKEWTEYNYKVFSYFR